MGLLQKAMETYEAMEPLAGIYEAGKEPLAPIGHIVTHAQIEVTINAQGDFVQARETEKNLKIIIPVTQKSSGRTSAPAAHPLCEQMGYLSGTDIKKYNLYLEGLKNWVRSPYTHPKAAAVLAYIQKKTIYGDLCNVGISADNEKHMVCWNVVGIGIDSETAVWRDVSLMEAYTAYYLSTLDGQKEMCMLTGAQSYVTWQHLKGIFSLNGNAKIISANDSANFTYRGRFTVPEEAASVGYIASQKAHNALKWLISTQGVIKGNRAFVCWNPRGHEVQTPLLPFLSLKSEDSVPDYFNYRQDLQRLLTSRKASLQVDDQVVVASFDAATTGRLAITYYSEMLGSDFLERLAYWDETCCFADPFKGVHSPPLYDIICYAFGNVRSKENAPKTDDNVTALVMQRLLSCRIDKAPFPLDIMRALVSKANNLQLYENKFQLNNLLFITCSVIQKYYIDHHKEEFAMALEPERKDRSYQWGRLLAVFEKMERDTYDRSETRVTNAIRMQSMFVQRPAAKAQTLHEQIMSAYYPRLSMGKRVFYEKLIGEIMEQLSQFDPNEYGKPLTESYLPGYYLQKNALYAQKNDENTEDE